MLIENLRIKGVGGYKVQTDPSGLIRRIYIWKPVRDSGHVQNRKGVLELIIIVQVFQNGQWTTVTREGTFYKREDVERNKSFFKWLGVPV